MADRPYQDLSEQQLDNLAESLFAQSYEALKDLREMWTNAADHDRLKGTEEYRKLVSYESGLNNDRNKVVAELAICQIERAECSTGTRDMIPRTVEVEIRLGHNPSPEKREAAEELAQNLRENGQGVAVTTYPEGWASPPRGITPVEQVLIFIGSGVATTLLNAVVTDVYNTAKIWARKRFGTNFRRLDTPTQEIQIILPGGTKIVWELDNFGEHERDTRQQKIEVSVTLEAVGDNRVRLMKELRTIFRADIEEVKYAIDNTPVLLVERTDNETADQIKTALEERGRHRDSEAARK